MECSGVINTDFKILEGKDLDDIINVIKEYEDKGYEIDSDIKRMHDAVNKWFVCMKRNEY